jgi:uncharacterized damage-inducible protein DinB
MPDILPWTRPLSALLEQGAELAGGLGSEGFGPHALAPGGGVGAHLRHVADTVAAFLRGLEDGAIDYDRRERDERIEREPARARARFLALGAEVRRMEGRDPAEELLVRAEACTVGAAWQRSTLARELVVLLSHTVHHYALIAVLLRARGIEPPPDLGVAPSTLAHWNGGRTACAPRAG